MTTREVLLRALRRWYVVMLGLVLTASAGYLLITRMPVVYSARTSVTVLPSESNPLRADGTAINGMAVILALRANGGSTPIKTSSPETTLYGEGLLDGSRVRIRDTGGQWATQIAEPVIYVEAIGATPEVVTTRVNRMVGSLKSDLDRLQRELGVDRSTAMFLRVSPDPPSAERITGNRTRVLAATALIGMALTAVALTPIDRMLIWLGRRRSGRQARAVRKEATSGFGDDPSDAVGGGGGV